MGQALRGEPLTVYGDGSQTRSFCYVTDLVDGIYRLLHTDFHEPVNLGNPDEITHPRVRQGDPRAGPGSKSTIVYKPLPQDDPKVRKPDITPGPAAARLGAARCRAEGLKRTLEYFRGRLQK